MQRPLKSTSFQAKIGVFVACGRVIERERDLEVDPFHTFPAKLFTTLQIAIVLQQALILYDTAVIQSCTQMLNCTPSGLYAPIRPS